MTETGGTVEELRERWERTLDIYGPKRHRRDYLAAGQLTEAAETILALLAVVEAAQEAVPALAELAWISYEGDPWYAEKEGVDAGAVRDKERRFNDALLLLHTQASDEGEAK